VLDRQLGAGNVIKPNEKEPFCFKKQIQCITKNITLKRLLKQQVCNWRDPRVTPVAYRSFNKKV
jgi:hypothetical protein